MNKRVDYDKTKVIQVLRWLEEIVPSFDRIGSCAAETTPFVLAQMTNDFIKDWEVFRKLLEARRILAEPFSKDEQEDMMAGVPYWRLDARLPPNEGNGGAGHGSE